MDPSRLFRKAALEKMASPERLDEMMVVTAPLGWLSLLALGVALGGAVVWGVYGTIAKKVAQKIKKELEKTLEPLDVLSILRKHIRIVSVAENTGSRNAMKKEVILSGYLLNGGAS